MKLFYLSRRNILDILRKPSVQICRLVQKIVSKAVNSLNLPDSFYILQVIAFVIGLCYSGTLSANQTGIITTQGAIVAMVCENVFSPMYGVLASFPQDLTLFTREHNSGLYSAGIFYLSKMIAFVSIQKLNKWMIIKRRCCNQITIRKLRRFYEFLNLLC